MLFDSILNGQYDKLKDLVLEFNSLNFFNKDGESPLSVACYEVDDENVQDVMYLMLSKGAKINAYQKPGFTPLFNATLALRPFVVELLLKNGAEPNINFFAEEFPDTVSSALDMTFTRLLEASIIKFENKNPFKEDKLIQIEIKGCNQIIKLLNKFGAKLRTLPIDPTLS